MNLVYTKFKDGTTETLRTDKTLAVLLPKLSCDPRGLSEFSIRPDPMVVSNKKAEVASSDKSEAPDNKKSKPTKEIKISGESLREYCVKNDMSYLLEDWDEEANLPYTPDNIKPKSGHKVSWKCRNCGFQWFAPPATRTNGSKCRRCKA